MKNNNKLSFMMSNGKSLTFSKVSDVTVEGVLNWFNHPNDNSPVLKFSTGMSTYNIQRAHIMFIEQPTEISPHLLIPQGELIVH